MNITKEREARENTYIKKVTGSAPTPNAATKTSQREQNAIYAALPSPRTAALENAQGPVVHTIALISVSDQNPLISSGVNLGCLKKVTGAVKSAIM